MHELYHAGNMDKRLCIRQTAANGCEVTKELAESDGGWLGQRGAKVTDGIQCAVVYM